MISINLLPASYRKAKTLDYYWRLVVLLGSICLVVLILISLALILIKSNLEQSITIPRDTAQFLSTRFVELETRVKALKQEVELLENTPNHGYSDILTKVYDLSPAEVEILTVDTNENGLHLKGYSPRRTKVLDFQAALEANFPQVEAPLSNLVNAFEVNFTFTINTP